MHPNTTHVFYIYSYFLNQGIFHLAILQTGADCVRPKRTNWGAGDGHTTGKHAGICFSDIKNSYHGLTDLYVQCNLKGLLVLTNFTWGSTEPFPGKEFG